MASFWSKFQQGRPLSYLSKQISRCKGGIVGREGMGLSVGMQGVPKARSLLHLQQPFFAWVISS